MPIDSDLLQNPLQNRGHAWGKQEHGGARNCRFRSRVALPGAAGSTLGQPLSRLQNGERVPPAGDIELQTVAADCRVPEPPAVRTSFSRMSVKWVSNGCQTTKMAVRDQDGRSELNLIL